MPLFARLISLGRSLTRESHLDRDLDAELASAVNELAARYERSGLEPAAARRKALIELGGIAQVTDDVRRGRPGASIGNFARDLRYGWRALWKAKSFAAAAILTLALGIGANSVIFSLVSAILIEPLPFRDPDRLVFIWGDMTAAGYPRAPIAGPELKDLRDRSTSFSGIGAIWATTTALTGEGDPEQLRIGLVSSDFFTVLGVEALLGRTFRAGDESTDHPPAILLSASVWQRRYGADPAIVGRTILVNDHPTTVIGVMAPTFRLFMPPDASVPDDLQAWLPFDRDFTANLRGQLYLRTVGRMRPGVSIDAAAREVAGIAAQISREFPEYGSAGRAFSVVGLQADGVREIRPALVALFAGVVILLLIACVNVASLLVARAVARTRETSLRIVLGASRGRLLSQCLAEGLVLATLGAVAGMLTARWGLRLLQALRPASLDRIEAAHVDLRVLGFTVAVTLAVGLVFSLAPLAGLLKSDLRAALQGGGRQTSGRIGYRLRSLLVVAQIALSVVLLVAAGLLVRTFLELQRVDPGFRSEGILTFRLALPGSRYPSQDAVTAFGRRFLAELRALPAVTGAGAVSHVPFDNIPNWSTTYLTSEGADPSLAARADQRAVTPGWFETVGATLVDGRFFTEDDDHTGQPVVIVDESLARRAWPGEQAVGKRIAVDPRVTGSPTDWVTVVGVVKHLRHLSLLGELREQVHLPVRQAPRNPIAYMVRTTADPAALSGPIREVVARLDPQLPIFDVRPLDEYVAGARATERFTMWLAAAFAGVALALALVGLYGVIAYSVACRRGEFGVRLALGAGPRAVIGLVLREGVRLSIVGLVLGTVGAAMASLFLERQLYGVDRLDPASYAIAWLSLGVGTLASCWLPARRATATALDGLRAE